MAIDPSIALQVRQPQILSPFDANAKAVTVADVMGQMQERQSLAAEREAQAPIRAAQAAAQQKQLAENSALSQAFEGSVGYDQDAGDLSYDDSKAAQILHSQNMDYLLPQYQAKKDQARAAHRTQALNEIGDAQKTIAVQAVPAENFLSIDDPGKRKAAYPSLRAQLIAANPGNGKLLPNDYDPDTVDKLLQSVIDQHDQTKDVQEKLKDAQSKQGLSLQTPEGREKEIAAQVQQFTQQNGGQAPDQETLDAIREGVMQKAGFTGFKVARRAPAKAIPLLGSDAPDDATDSQGNPIPDEWRKPGVKLLLNRASGHDVYQVTTPDKLNAQQTKDKVNQDAYAASIGKQPEDLTAADKFQANIWAAKQTPQRLTDWQRKAEMFRTNPQMYSDMTGHLLGGQVKPLTAAEKIHAIAQINAATLKQFPHMGDPKDPDAAAAQAFRQQQIDQYEKDGLSLTGTPAAPKAPAVVAPKPASPGGGPKLGAPVYRKGTSQILGYFDGYDASGKVKTRPTP